jgi:hypothetical protein
VKHTIKYGYFLYLIIYFYIICNIQDIDKIYISYYLGYISIIYIILFTSIEPAIFQTKPTIRTFSAGLISSLLAIIFCCLKQKESSKGEYLFFIYYCGMIAFIFYKWTLLGFCFSTSFIGMMAVLTSSRIFSSYKARLIFFSFLVMFSSSLASVFYIANKELIFAQDFDLSKDEKKIKSILFLFEDQGLVERIVLWKTALGSLIQQKEFLGSGAGQTLAPFQETLIEERARMRKRELRRNKVSFKLKGQLHNSFITLIFNFGFFSILWFFPFSSLLISILRRYEFDVFMVFCAVILSSTCLHEVFFIHLIGLLIAFFMPRGTNLERTVLVQA